MELSRAKNVATYIVFPLCDADGDPVSAAGSLDSEIDAWADGAAPDGFADCTNEATEIGTTGQYYLSLTQSEMNNDYIIIQVKSTGAKTQTILINTKLHATIPAASVIADAVWDEAQSGHTTAGTFGRYVDAQLATIEGYIDTEIAAILAAVDTEVAAIKAKTDNLPAAPADDTSIDSQLATIAGYIDTEIAAIKAKTDLLTFVNAHHLEVEVQDKTGFSLSVTPPTAVQIRTEMDSNSTKLANLDTTVSSRLASASYTAPDNASIASTLAAVDTEIAAIKAKTDLLTFVNTHHLEVEVQDKTGFSLSVTPPTAVQIRSEMDSNSTKLANLDATVSSRLASASYTAPPTAATVADAVWDEAQSGHTGAGTFGRYIDAQLATIAGYIDTEIAAILAAVDTEVAAIKAKTDNLPAAPADDTSIDSQLATIAGYLDTEVAAIKAKTDLLTFVNTHHLEVEVQDKTGFSLSVTPPTAAQIRSEMDSNSTKLANLDATVSSRLAAASYTAPANSDITAIKAKTDLLTFVNTHHLEVDVQDKTGFALSAAGIDAIWDETQSGHVTAGTFGFLLDAAISSKLASASYSAPPTAAAIRTEMDGNSTKLANLDSAVSSRLAAASYTAPDNASISSILAAVDTEIAAIKAKTDLLTFVNTHHLEVEVQDKTGFSLTVTPPTAAAIRTEIDSNSTKLANLDATVSSRLAGSSYTAPDNAGIAAIKAKTDMFPVIWIG